jgi:hypothetical protein
MTRQRHPEAGEAGREDLILLRLVKIKNQKTKINQSRLLERNQPGTQNPERNERKERNEREERKERNERKHCRLRFPSLCSGNDMGGAKRADLNHMCFICVYK